MKKVWRWFFNGLIAFLPVSITLYVAWWILSNAEGVFGTPLRQWLGLSTDEGGYYFYGLGLLLMFCFLVLFGLFTEFYLGRLIMGWSESLFNRIPGVKQIYGSIKEIIDFFNPQKKLANNNYMVIVTLMPDVRTLGYVTRDTLTSLKGNLGGDDEVVVILPFCYQMGGNTIIVPRRLVRPVDLSFEEGMKVALSGFVLGDEVKNDGSGRKQLEGPDEGDE
jgi:uncharacterized membrane protein